MAATFDGDNLIMTLDTPATQDVLENWYEDWKDWSRAHPDNRKYPQLFFSEGGAPVDATQFQGAYIRCNNAAGWRIKPPEQDIEIAYTGSLLRTDNDLPVFTGTTGSFNTFVYNVQPITTIVNAGFDATQEANMAFIRGQLENVENGWDHDQMMRLILAALAAEMSGPTPGQAGTVLIRDILDAKNRISMPVDAAGYRTGPASYDPD